MTKTNYVCADCKATLKHSSPSMLKKHETSNKHIRSISKKAEEIELKIEYPLVYATAEIIDLDDTSSVSSGESAPAIKYGYEVSIKFKCELNIKEKSAIINALKFKFIVCLPTYLQDNNYQVCITRGIHKSNWRCYHFNGYYRDRTTGETMSPILHFNLKNFKWENIPCITNVTSINNHKL